MSSLDMAEEIVALHAENRFLRSEYKRLLKVEEEYRLLLAESVQHGEIMMGRWFDLFLKNNAENVVR